MANRAVFNYSSCSQTDSSVQFTVIAFIRLTTIYLSTQHTITYENLEIP